MTQSLSKMVLAVTVLVLALAGCASKTKVESDLHIKGAPDWVNEGTQMLNDKGGRLFHGVGQAPAMGDDSLQLATADDRARAELARILSSYLDVASKDYTAAATNGGTTTTQQSVSRDIENLSRVNLTGAKIIGRWRDKKTNMVYSIAELDMKQVKDTLEKVQEMNQGLRDHLTREGDSIFDRLAGDKK